MTLHDTPPAVVEPDLLQLAEDAAEAIRALCHRTRGQHALVDPAELSRLLAELSTMTSRLPQLLDQLHRWLRHQHDTGRVRADTDADPDQLVCQAAAQLTGASHSAHRLAGTLDTAHQHVAHLGRQQGNTGPKQERTTERGVSFRP